MYANRTAIGVASITAVTVLFLGGAQDVIAGTLNMRVGQITTILQILLLVAPPIAFVVTRRSCLALQHRPAPDRTERRVPVERTADGGYDEPEDDGDWMDSGGAAPGHFDDIAHPEHVRGVRR